MYHTHPVRIDIMFDICNYKDLFCQRTVTGSRLQHEVAKIWWMQSWRLLELATRLGATPLCMKPRLSLRPSRSRASLMTFTVFKIENVAFCIHYLARKLGPIVQVASWPGFQALNVSHAFHSSLMNPMLEAFRKEAKITVSCGWKARLSRAPNMATPQHILVNRSSPTWNTQSGRGQYLRKSLIFTGFWWW